MEMQSSASLDSHQVFQNVVLPHLARDSGRKLGHRLPGAKGGVWMLDFRVGKLRTVEYRPPAA